MQTAQQNLGDYGVVTFESPKAQFGSSDNLRSEQPPKDAKDPASASIRIRDGDGSPLFKPMLSRFGCLWRVFENQECVRCPQTYEGKPRGDPVKFDVVKRVD